MIPYSVLDLSPIAEGAGPRESFANSADLARHAEALGYRRYWLAEHHNMPGIASAATSVVIGHVAAATKTIRVGSGGIMLPNHAPLVIAEQFGTLQAIHGDRIDLGLGRAPGTDMGTARALRRGMSGADEFPEDVQELIALLDTPSEGQRVRAIPGAGANVPVYILGSSLYGAQMAAHMGLPYAFASHFAPQMLVEAAYTYRGNFRPSQHLAEPHFMMAVNVFAGETDAEGARLKSSMQLSFANLRLGRPSPLPRAVDAIERHLEPMVLEMVNQALSVSACGAPETVRDQLAELIRVHRPDEVIVNGQIHDHAARKQSFTIAAEALKALGTTDAAAAATSTAAE